MASEVGKTARSTLARRWEVNATSPPRPAAADSDEAVAAVAVCVCV